MPGNGYWLRSASVRWCVLTVTASCTTRIMDMDTPRKKGRPKGSPNKPKAAPPPPEEDVDYDDEYDLDAEYDAYEQEQEKKPNVKIGGKDRGRPPGARNLKPRSKELLSKLENEHKFHVVPELIRIYSLNKRVYEPIMLKMVANKPLTATEESRVDRLGKEMKEILFKFMGYCYPKLRATEIQASSMERVVFNIISADSPVQKDEAAPKQTNNLLHLIKP